MVNLQTLIVSLKKTEPLNSEPTEFIISNGMELEKLYLFDLYYNLITKEEFRSEVKV